MLISSSVASQLAASRELVCICIPLVVARQRLGKDTGPGSLDKQGIACDKSYWGFYSNIVTNHGSSNNWFLNPLEPLRHWKLDRPYLEMRRLWRCITLSVSDFRSTPLLFESCRHPKCRAILRVMKREGGTSVSNKEKEGIYRWVKNEWNERNLITNKIK
jgi:hypothetical protein